MKKLIVAFRNFAGAPKNNESLNIQYNTGEGTPRDPRNLGIFLTPQAEFKSNNPLAPEFSFKF
jgi:hypothetical protein